MNVEVNPLCKVIQCLWLESSSFLSKSREQFLLDGKRENCTNQYKFQNKMLFKWFIRSIIFWNIAHEQFWCILHMSEMIIKLTHVIEPNSDFVVEIVKDWNDDRK